MMTRMVMVAIVASLAVASAATHAPSMQRAALPTLASHNTLRLRGGIADEELAQEAAKIGKV